MAVPGPPGISDGDILVFKHDSRPREVLVSRVGVRPNGDAYATKYLGLCVWTPKLGFNPDVRVLSRIPSLDRGSLTAMLYTAFGISDPDVVSAVVGVVNEEYGVVAAALKKIETAPTEKVLQALASEVQNLREEAIFASESDAFSRVLHKIDQALEELENIDG